nr:Apical junction molecule protein 1, isoform d [Haemonchus contortus]
MSLDISRIFTWRSQDDLVQRSRLDYRGPLLQKFHDGEFKKSKNDVDVISGYPRIGPSLYGEEFERLLEQTEQKYTTYRARMSQPNLHSRSRHWSTSYLETDVDTGKPEMTTAAIKVEETNLDDVHHRCGSVVDYQHRSMRDLSDESQVSTHIRSRSADYLMDKRSREETIPPENQLRKSLNESALKTSHVPYAEMRSRQSTEKLTVPDWYRGNRVTARPTDVDITLPRSDQSELVPGHIEQHHSRRQPDPYSSIFWFKKSALLSSPEFPKGMFGRYKNEIEDMRRSRSLLHESAEENRLVVTL